MPSRSSNHEFQEERDASAAWEDLIRRLALVRPVTCRDWRVGLDGRVGVCVCVRVGLACRRVGLDWGVGLACRRVCRRGLDWWTGLACRTGVSACRRVGRCDRTRGGGGGVWRIRSETYSSVWSPEPPPFP